ncbi:MAG TPA: hypothetical protein VF815_40370, partial [Myxococcaceae bacterium]
MSLRSSRSSFAPLLALLFLASCIDPLRPIVITDVDSDFDDIVSLAYLCQEHQLRNIQLAAV